MTEPNPQHSYRGFAAPVILILLGVLFLVGEFVPRLGLHRTWPVILIVAGLLMLARSVGPPRPPRGPRV